MRRKKTLIALTTFLTLALTAGFVWAGGWHGKRHMNPERMKKFVDWKVADVLEELEADEGQSEKINALKDALFEEAKSHFEGKAERRGEALELWEQKSPDRKAAHAMVDARIDELRALAHKATDAALDAHAVLTPEQRGKVAEHIRDRHR